MIAFLNQYDQKPIFLAFNSWFDAGFVSSSFGNMDKNLMHRLITELWIYQAWLEPVVTLPVQVISMTVLQKCWL